LLTLVGSKAFQAVGKISGPYNVKGTFLYWDEPYKWLGSFPIKWVSINWDG